MLLHPMAKLLQSAKNDGKIEVWIYSYGNVKVETSGDLGDLPCP